MKILRRTQPYFEFLSTQFLSGVDFVAASERKAFEKILKAKIFGKTFLITLVRMTIIVAIKLF